MINPEVAGMKIESPESEPMLLTSVRRILHAPRQTYASLHTLGAAIPLFEWIE